MVSPVPATQCLNGLLKSCRGLEPLIKLREQCCHALAVRLPQGSFEVFEQAKAIRKNAFGPCFPIA